jgi:hypothetical protein
VQRKAQRKENRITEDSVKLCQEGIERVQRVHEEELCFEFRDKRSVEEKDTYRVVEHSVGSTRCA